MIIIMIIIIVIIIKFLYSKEKGGALKLVQPKMHNIKIRLKLAMLIECTIKPMRLQPYVARIYNKTAND